MTKPPAKISIYCEEGKLDDGTKSVVLNTDRGHLQAAFLTKDDQFIKWIGRECIHDIAPRRHAQDHIPWK